MLRPSRCRIFLTFCGVLSAVLVNAANGAEPPNVVLIISDDHAWTDYGFMGHPHLQTPRLDRLSRESLTFRHGYVPSSLCCPSLASIITGRYPHQHRITSNDPPRPAGVAANRFHQSPEFATGREMMNRFLDVQPTLPRLVGERNWVSLQTGKWWQGNFRRGGFTHGMTRGDRHGDDGLEIGRQTMQPIYDFIDEAQAAKKSFLVWYAPMMPHSPHTPPEPLLQKYLRLAASPHVARYWAMVEWFDQTVGALLDYLDKRGVSDNTIVVYVTDNGWIQNPENAQYAARSKQSPYDGGLRTPIMIRWPGHVTPRICDTPVTSIDILPTVGSALELPLPADLPGINLLDEAQVANRQAIFGECFTHNAVDLAQPAKNLRWRWVVANGWKLIDPDAQNEPDARRELYHLGNDPHEEQNLAEEHPERVHQLAQQLDAWWNAADASP